MSWFYKWCWITSSAFYRHSAFGEHLSLPAMLLYYIWHGLEFQNVCYMNYSHSPVNMSIAV